MSLIADRVTKTFGQTVAVDALSFEFPAGRVTGLLGPNGAGKSTTIRVAMGLMQPDSGTIAWRGEPVASLDRRRVGYLPEQIGVYEKMPVVDHVAFFAELHGLSRSDARSAAARWAERLGLPADSPVGDLSKGNQQRVQLASALAHEPELVVLDEPFSGLDPIGQAFVEDVMTELAAGGATLILSSHEIERVERFCEFVALIDHGALRFDGTAAELRGRHPGLRLRRIELAEPCPALLESVADLQPALDQGDSGTVVLEAPADAIDPETLLQRAIEAGARVVGLGLIEPTMRELFVREVGGEHGAAIEADAPATVPSDGGQA